MGENGMKASVNAARNLDEQIQRCSTWIKSLCIVFHLPLDFAALLHSDWYGPSFLGIFPVGKVPVEDRINLASFSYGSCFRWIELNYSVKALWDRSDKVESTANTLLPEKTTL